MPIIKKQAITPYSASNMFALVNAIDTYPEFLPWCSGSEIISSDEDEVIASITISASGMEKTFTTSNRVMRHKMIEVRLVDGPFKHLHGFWRFDDLEEKGSEVRLDLEFELAGKLLDLAIGPIFTQVSGTMVEAFCERAKQIYG